jgi:DNA-binding response OmpR family regulator
MSDSRSPDKSLKKNKPYIMVIDDEKDAVELLALILSKYDYTVEKCYRTSDADRILENGERKPDLIILDVKLPGVDGITYCKQLHENPKYSDIPIILISALCFENDIEKGLAAGAKDYILKPWSNMDLVERINRHLKSN